MTFAAAPASDLRARSASGRDRIALCDVLLDRVDLREAANRLHRYLASDRMHQIVPVNLDCLRIAQTDATYRRTINEADLAVADGMPLVWASRLAGYPLPARVTGNALIEECCRLSASSGASIFLLGGRPGIADEAARAIGTRYPGALVAGVYSPPFGPLSPREDHQIVDRINGSGARILLVGLGAPRQDNWIRAHRDQLAVKVALGIGCGIDLLAGVVSRAPLWMQHAGLEWLYRFHLEPRRLWRRYLVDDTPMFARLVAESLRAARA
jgi:N-acetylglucosaminyldiphosphoundecaprenol N-acetyl-beta-D-mannosaminyltransferase